MKVPSEVVWSLTKRWNAFVVKDRRVARNTFTRDPINVTNLHNASSAGLSNARQVSATLTKEKAKKGNRRVITLTQNHKQRNHIKKAKHSGLVYSNVVVKKEVSRAAKAVKNFTHLSDAQKKRVLKRLQALHNANTVKPKTRKTVRTQKL